MSGHSKTSKVVCVRLPNKVVDTLKRRAPRWGYSEYLRDRLTYDIMRKHGKRGKRNPDMPLPVGVSEDELLKVYRGVVIRYVQMYQKYGENQRLFPTETYSRIINDTAYAVLGTEQRVKALRDWWRENYDLAWELMGVMTEHYQLQHMHEMATHRQNPQYGRPEYKKGEYDSWSYKVAYYDQQPYKGHLMWNVVSDLRFAEYFEAENYALDLLAREGKTEKDARIEIEPSQQPVNAQYYLHQLRHAPHLLPLTLVTRKLPPDVVEGQRVKCFDSGGGSGVDRFTILFEDGSYIASGTEPQHTFWQHGEMKFWNNAQFERQQPELGRRIAFRDLPKLVRDQLISELRDTDD